VVPPTSSTDTESANPSSIRHRLLQPHLHPHPPRTRQYETPHSGPFLQVGQPGTTEGQGHRSSRKSKSTDSLVPGVLTSETAPVVLQKRRSSNLDWILRTMRLPPVHPPSKQTRATQGRHQKKGQSGENHEAATGTPTKRKQGRARMAPRTQGQRGERHSWTSTSDGAGGAGQGGTASSRHQSER